MKRWIRTAFLCALIAAVCHSSPVNAAISNGQYIAETTAINVVNHFPDNMAVGISPETPLTVEFGGALNQSFYQNVSFNLFNGTEPVNGELFYNPAARQIMFKASKPLNQGQTYTAQVSFYDGLGRTSEKVWSFQTANLGSATTNNNTNNNSNNISKANTPSSQEQNASNKNLVLTNASMGIGTIRSDAPMEVSFSEALDVASLKSAPVQLFENNRPVGIDYRLSKDMKTITVSPRNALKANASYAITIDKTIASTSGKKLAKKTLIPFKLSDNASESAVSQYELEERPAPKAAIANNINNGLQQGQALYQQGQQNINQALNGYQQNANQNLAAMQQNANQALNGYQQNASQNYAAMQQNANQALNGYQQNINQNLAGMQQNANQALNGYQQNARQNYAAMQQNLNKNLGTVGQAMQSNIENPFDNQNSTAFKPNMTNYSVNQLQVARAQQQLQQQAPVAEQVKLIGLAPQNGSKVTNLAQPITIGFSEEIKPETLNEFTFRLEDDFGPVPAKIHYFKGNKQATLTPIGLLEAEKNYRVIVTQGITDLSGRPIKSGINSMFATTTPTSAPAVPNMTVPQSIAANVSPQREAQELESFDNARASVAPQYNNSNKAAQNNYNQTMAYKQPQNEHTNNPYMSRADRTVRTSVKEEVKALNNFKVASIYPGLNSDNISRKSKIAIHFSEPCDPKTVNNINISVFANQTRVDGKVTYDKRNNRAIFEPSRPLEAKTEHKVIVSDKILSKSGEQLSQRFSWTFSTTSDTRNQYMPTIAKTAEADSAFYIPLVDSKVKMTPGQSAALAAQKSNATNTSTSSFTYVSSKHWSFKSMKHITNKGILNSYPFTFTDNVTRYEFASAINNALNNLKAMQNANSKKLRVADMIELEQLIIEYRNELKSYGVNTAWFETFLQGQGVNLNQVETKVRQLNS
ncbi:MAG: Ig-like domain-containing protein [Candidatus Riflebacteria bacterium]|nr:Ig-like domain-containing protein [Candidatus Riflebacteria bacterium]